MHIIESKPKENFQAFPLMYLKPCNAADAPWKTDPKVYNCPLYRTTDRRGVLMTTGHSTNYIMPWYLPLCDTKPPQYWVKRGTALFGSLPY